jgi:hypothetical protein
MAAVFPSAVKIFQVYHDYTDIIWAISINECHDEIQALEHLVGVNPFQNTPYTSVGQALQDLWLNKAPNNHTHTHRNLLDDAQGNDHPQYILTNGQPGFTGPVGGKAGSAPSDLVPLSQLQSMGYQNSAQVQAAVNGALGSLMAGAAGGPPLVGAPASSAWRIQGGVHSGLTNGSGQIGVYFNPGYGHCVQAFTATKLPPSGGGPPYNWIEAQLTLVGVSSAGAVLQFSHDYSWQPGMWVSFSWIAMGN